MLRLYDQLTLIDQLQRNPHHPGTGRLRAVLDGHLAGSTDTWSELEELCLSATRAAGVPPPEVNAWVDPGDGEPPMRVDFVWRDQRVTVEADGFATHRTHGAFESDRRRDQRLHVAGWRPVRVTWRQLVHERARIERDARRAAHAGVSWARRSPVASQPRRARRAAGAAPAPRPPQTRPASKARHLPGQAAGLADQRGHLHPGRPQATTHENGCRSFSTLTAKPWVVTPRATCTPIEAILRSPTHTPV